MLRFYKIVNHVVLRSVRPATPNFHNQNPLVSNYIFYKNGSRSYGRKYDDCKVNKPDCKPKEKSECKKPDIKECDKKPMPSLQECQKPNLMSECPKPACPYDDGPKKDNKNLILLALIALAATVGALYYFLSSKEQKPPKKSRPSKKQKPKVVVKTPANSKDLPKEVPYLLIGGGTAAFAAFRAIKSNDPTAKVLVITNEEYFPYMRPPLSKELWFSDDPNSVSTLDFKQWNGSQRSLFYEPNDFYLEAKDLLINENGGVSVAKGWTVTHLDVINKKAFLDDGCEIMYHKCLIATGSLPKNLDIFENAERSVLDRVTTFRTVSDFQCLNQKLCTAKSVAIVGGGFLGSELACAFGRMTKTREDFKVYQIFKEPGHMGSILPEYLSHWTSYRVKKEGVQVMPLSEVVGVCGNKDEVTLTLSSGKSVTVDYVVVAVGAAPNTDIGIKSDLEIDPKVGGYLVNTELQARTSLYVAGDAACFYDPRLGRRRIEHHDNAVISGRLAGENMTGAAKPYMHQSMFWSDLGPDIGYEAIGLVNSCLPTVGVFAKLKPPADAPLPVLEKEMPEECTKYISKEEEERQNQKKAINATKLQEIEEKKKQREKEQKDKAANAEPKEDFSKGVIFYLRDDIIVGIVLWNVFNRMSIARQVLKDQRKYEDLNEVAKLFNIHED